MASASRNAKRMRSASMSSWIEMVVALNEVHVRGVFADRVVDRAVLRVEHAPLAPARVEGGEVGPLVLRFPQVAEPLVLDGADQSAIVVRKHTAAITIKIGGEVRAEMLVAAVRVV